MLNEMWVKCSDLSYFSLLIAWEAGSSFYLHGINGWSIYSKENSSFYLEEIEWGLPHLLLFFIFQFEDIWIYSPFSYLHNFHSAFCSNIFFCFFWPLLPLFITWLPPSNGNTSPNQYFPPAYVIFQVGSWEFHQSSREILWKVGYPAAALDLSQTSRAPAGVSPLPPLAALAKLPQWSMAWIFQRNPWILQLWVLLWALPRTPQNQPSQSVLE